MASRVMQDLSGRLRIIMALMLRDLMGRFGRNSLGFVWTVLEPMLLTSGVIVLWSLIQPAIYHGIPVVAFVLTGYMPLTMWRHLTNPMANIFRNNSTLLFHRQISHIEILIARQVLEFLSTSMALVIVYLVVNTLGIVDEVVDPGLLLAAWLYIAWLNAGFGMIIAAITEIWVPSEKLLPPLQYLALPLSGVFAMVDWLPGDFQKLILLNPMVSCVEMFRAGFFGGAITTHYNLGYLTLCCTAITVCGIGALYHVRDHIRFA